MFPQGAFDVPNTNHLPATNPIPVTILQTFYSRTALVPVLRAVRRSAYHRTLAVPG